MLKCTHQRVVVGPGDDAGVLRFKSNLLVETVDVITPIVDDPYTFGAICAANSVSDVYAMGGRPLSALAILGFSSCDYPSSAVKSLLKGCIDKLKEAGACLIGGHSIDDKEFKFGLAVTGAIDNKTILKVAGASAGEVLILTKPLGTGIITSAAKRGKVKSAALNRVIASMLKLNKTASMAAVACGSQSATDVTGFGLLGHGLNMAKSSKADLVIFYDKVPLMDEVKKCAAAGLVPKGAQRNLEFCKKDVIFSNGISKEEQLILSDPQTSGGLLIALPPKGLKKFDRIAKKERMPYWIIGEVIKGKGRIIVR
ncbi:MAG: selenide, water dikinase SelD [Nitrospirae bacterium]|nr:selenide, water dikinase SelD [Nitrospirota bacterium]